MTGDRHPGREPTCPRIEEAFSARLDGEDPGMDDAVLDAHLARCEHCRRFAEWAEATHRRSRVRRASPVPDLSGRILDELALHPPPPRTGRRGERRRQGGVVRRVHQHLLALVAAVAIVALGFGAGALASTELGGGSSAPASSNDPYPGATVLDRGVVKPNVVLTDTEGRPYDVAQETAGKITLVYFGYTHCPDLCPINMALTAAAVRDLPAADRRRVAVVFITTDPQRDNPAVIRAWLNRFSPSFIGLTGPISVIHRAEVQVAMPLSYVETAAVDGQGYQVVHAGYTLVYSPDGESNLTVDDTTLPSQYAKVLERLITQGYQAAR